MDADHEIFQRPLKVDLEYEDVATPKNYSRYIGGAELGDTIAVWRVHDRLPGGNAGLVSDGYRFGGGPDTEFISGGLNSKNVGAVALGRQGNWFLWGFAAAPDEMRPAARRVFVNTLAYMKQFAGRKVVRDKVATAREWAINYVELVTPEQRSKVFPMIFAADLLAVQAKAPDEFGAFLEEHLDHIYAIEKVEPTGRKASLFTLDADTVALGIANHDPALLERCVSDLENDRDSERARRLLERYTGETHGVAAAAWRQWLDGVADRLRFSDALGYRFFVTAPVAAPRRALEVGELDLAAPIAVSATASDTELRLVVVVKPPWHMYPPGAVDGMPIEVEVLASSSFAAAGPLQVQAGDHGVLEGEVEITVPLRRTDDGSKLAVDFTYQVCDPRQCLPPDTVRLEQK